MGVNGTGYFQRPGANVSETLPCCSSVSTSVRVQNETVNGSVIAESNPNHSGLAKPNSLKSTGGNGSLTRKLLKAVADTKRDIKMLNKVISWKIMRFWIFNDITWYPCFFFIYSFWGMLVLLHLMHI